MVKHRKLFVVADKMWFFQRRRYEVLEDQEIKSLQKDNEVSDSRALAPSTSFRSDSQHSLLLRKYWSYMIWMSIFNGVCLILSSLLFIYWFKNQFTGMNALLKKSSFWSKFE